MLLNIRKKRDHIRDYIYTVYGLLLSAYPSNISKIFILTFKYTFFKSCSQLNAKKNQKFHAFTYGFSHANRTNNLLQWGRFLFFLRFFFLDLLLLLPFVANWNNTEINDTISKLNILSAHHILKWRNYLYKRS